MIRLQFGVALLSIYCALAAGAASPDVTVTVDRNSADSANGAFKFAHVPPPARNDAAANAKFNVVDGARDQNGGSVDRLRDGRLPDDSDGPGQAFFFRQGADGGRIAVDLTTNVSVKELHTYSWHTDTRAPQVYRVYGSTGEAAGFNASPERSVEPTNCGWTFIAEVDTRPQTGPLGGQYGVSIARSNGNLGEFRHLLFDIRQTESNDPFGNTFYCEIDVIDAKATNALEAASSQTITRTFDVQNGKYQITFDNTLAPDLTNWTYTVLAPAMVEWYPKLVEMLPSEGFNAPARVTIAFKEDMGGTPAAASGSRIGCNVQWFRRNLKGEAKGSVIHELVHVIQQYGRRRGGGTRPPGWLTEGIPDYIRWYKYEPQTRGADVPRSRVDSARYDASYRVSANFLNWVSDTYDKNFVKTLNAALREGRYSEELWKTATGKTVADLGAEWKKWLEAGNGVR